MGGASAMGAGLALARPERRVIVFDGDGSLLMQLGSLATIAGARPRNLVHLLFKNGVYHTSGSQDIPGGLTVDFVTMARGAGYKSAMAITTLEEFKRKLPELLTAEGPIFVELHTSLADQTPMTARGGRSSLEPAPLLALSHVDLLGRSRVNRGRDLGYFVGNSGLLIASSLAHAREGCKPSGRRRSPPQ